MAPKLAESNGIDPFAPKGSFPLKADGITCSHCNKYHPCTTKYVCKKHGILCSSQTLYKYKSGMEDNPYVDQAVDYSICSYCGERVTQVMEL